MAGQPISILMIEDDPDYVEIVRLCLDEPDSMGLHFELERADRLELGLRLLDAAAFDALLLDLSLPDSRGLETISRVLAHGVDLPILVMTNLGDERAAFEAMRLGAQDYMVKATSDSRLLKRAIWYAIERHKLLKQSERVIRAAPDGMVVCDAQDAVRYANPAACRLLDATLESLLGRPCPVSARANETRLVTRSGPDGERIIEVRATAIDWRGQPATLAALRDITELRRVEQLKAEIRERRRLDRLKDEFLGTVSHELRTPLTIVKGAIDNLHEGVAGALSAAQSEIVGIAQRNVDRLAKMINNLLDLSRLEAGQGTVVRRRFELAPLIRELAAGFRLAAERRGIRVDVEAPSSGPVEADAELIGRVITNLLDNALRFARSRVRLRVAETAAGVTAEIIDDGTGIPPEKASALFNKFVQINRPRGGPGYKGTGLGLAISRQIVEQHGGRIDYRPADGGGSCFSFTLPPAGAAGAARATAKQPREGKG